MSLFSLPPTPFAPPPPPDVSQILNWVWAQWEVSKPPRACSLTTPFSQPIQFYVDVRVYLRSPLLRNIKGTVSLEFTAGQSTCPHIRVLLPQGTPTLTILALKRYFQRSYSSCAVRYFSVFRMYFLFECRTVNLCALSYSSFRKGLLLTPKSDTFILFSSSSLILFFTFFWIIQNISRDTHFNSR